MCEIFGLSVTFLPKILPKVYFIYSKFMMLTLQLIYYKQVVWKTKQNIILLAIKIFDGDKASALSFHSITTIV